MIRIIFFVICLSPLCSNSQNLNVAVAGLKHDHVNSILQQYKNGEVNILGIAEDDIQLIEKYKSRFNLPQSLFFSSIRIMLSKIKPDVVLAYNPVSEHVDVVEICGPLHLPVMVEKPLAATLSQAQRVQQLSNQYHIPVLTNYETTWYSSYHQIYNNINEQKIGPVRKLVVHDGHSGPIEIGCSKEFLSWLTNPVKNGGGALMDFGCYGANLMTWIMKGQLPISVTAITKHIKPALYPKIDDDATILVEYPNTTGIIEASWNWPFGIKDLEVSGKTGYYHALNGSMLKERLHEKDTLSNSAVAPYSFKNNIEYLKAFFNKSISTSSDPSSLENNMIVMQILEAAKRSAREGKKIILQQQYKKTTPFAVIFDTDMGPDYDDVGAITMLHAYADSGYINILATMASTRYDGVGAVLNVFNTYFNRPEIPIGIPKENGLKLKDWQHWTDSIQLHYPHAVKNNNEVYEASELYRKLLSAQPDHSVTIITVGFFTNLANLLKTPPDQYSSLTGDQLVHLKVKKLVSMAGRFPSGKEFNVDQDAASSAYVFAHWNTPVIFSGFEIGDKIKVGLPLINNSSIINSPVKDVFKISIPLAAEDSLGRKSWDETAVMVGVKGYAPYYKLITGKIIVAKDGSNQWNRKAAGHAYLKEIMPSLQVNNYIDQLIQHQPAIK